MTAARAAIDGEDLKLERQKAGLSRQAVADLVGVKERTVRNWEAGRSAVPYSAFKLLRITRGYALPSADWEGFILRGGVLWSPEGKAFAAKDFAWWSLTCEMARAFRKVMAERQGLFAKLQASEAALAAFGRGAQAPAQGNPSVMPTGERGLPDHLPNILPFPLQISRV